MNHQKLTRGNNNPNEVHEEVIAPEIVWFGSAVRQPGVVMVKHAGRIVEHITVELAGRDDRLEGMTERVVNGN